MADHETQESILRDTCAELVREGIIQQAALERAKRAAERTGDRIDVVLSRLGLANEDDVVRIMARRAGVDVLRPDEASSPVLLEGVPLEFLKRSWLIPLAIDDDTLTVVAGDLLNRLAVESLAHVTRRKVRILAATRSDVTSLFRSVYDTVAAGRAADAARQVVGDVDDDAERLRDLANEAPIISLVNDLIAGAVDSGASDIHVEPQDDCVWVRNRIDGVLALSRVIPLSSRAAMASRIKLMAELNIAERRLPQDGHLKMAVRGREVDFRVSSVPTLHGESIVLRILDQKAVGLDLADLGFDGALHEDFTKLLRKPNGVILVTGPTGSGKSTTLYAALKILNDKTRKIYTVEDPAEYFLPGVNQLQVRPKIGLDFASSLRSILRQDPDIIMIGEIRDAETARIAVQASLTGHLVLATLHTNSAASTVARLLDMGVEDYLLASTLSGIVAQRLVRRLCRHCAVSIPQPPALPYQSLIAELAGRLDFRGPVGCPKCRSTGFDGRMAIIELMAASASIREQIVRRALDADLQASAIAEGMQTMLINGLVRAAQGLTTVDEVLRVTNEG